LLRKGKKRQLREEMAEEREKSGEKNKDDNPPEDSGGGTARKTEFTTDPDHGALVKSGHERKFACEAHTACDRHNWISGVEAAAGNVGGANEKGKRLLSTHIWQEYLNLAEQPRKTPRSKGTNSFCKETMERVFADAKENRLCFIRPLLFFSHLKHLVLDLAEHLGAQSKKLDAMPVLLFGMPLVPHHHADDRAEPVLHEVLIRKRKRLAFLVAGGALDARPALADIDDQAVLEIGRGGILFKIVYPRALIDGDPAVPPAFFHRVCISPP